MANKKIDKYMAVEAESGDNMQWHGADESPFVLEGFHWRKKGGAFRRLPASSKKSPLPEGADRMADHSAGGQLRFKTDSANFMVKASVRTMDNNADIMTFSRVGFDLYAGAGANKHFVGVSRLNFDKVDRGFHSYCATVFAAGSKAMREYTLNFPLYASVETFALGLDKGAKVEAPSPRRDQRPVVVYGTSIQQGCCASRPGLCHTNILSRTLDRPFLNLGFAGSGRGEPEVARVLATIKDPALYILDYDSNSSVEGLTATLANFTDILRQAHPETPVLTVSRMRYPSDYPLDPEGAACSEELIQRTAVHIANLQRRRAAGDRKVHFLDGVALFGEDYADCSTDNCHANDLGFHRIAKVMAPEIERILSA